MILKKKIREFNRRLRELGGIYQTSTSIVYTHICHQKFINRTKQKSLHGKYSRYGRLS